MTDDPEQTCTRCRESWPATKEFFSSSAKGNRLLHSWCKACQTEAKRQALPPRPTVPVPEVFAVSLRGRQ